MMQIVRIGTVTTIDPAKRTARVKFQDAGTSSGWLYVLTPHPPSILRWPCYPSYCLICPKAPISPKINPSPPSTGR